MLFRDLNLPESLTEALDKIGFIEATDIQKKAIPLILEGRDIMACAETGSGKTGAYLIPMVKALIEDPKSQGMVLAPTRELAQQISDFLKSIVPDERKFHTTRLVGGMDIRKQFKSLQRKPRIIVATPGRLIDHLKRNTVQIHKVNHLVLDEGDRMIDMGFAPQLKQILQFLPEERQTSFFTATLDEKVKELAKKYLVNPATLMLSQSRPVSKIKQSVIQVEFKDKDECILHELNQRQGSVIVFVKTKYRTDRLKKYLAEYGFEVDLIHGGRTQGQRNRAINGFKSGKTRVLCATDVAARGIDVPQVEHVINFDLPMQDEDYVHRVGRTARNGAEGEAVSFVMPDEHRDWNRIVKKYDIPNALLEESRGKRSGASKDKKGPKKGSFGKKKSFSGEKKSSFGKKKKSFSKKNRFADEDKEFSFRSDRSSGKKKSSSKKKRFADERDSSLRGERTEGRKKRFSDDDRGSSFRSDRSEGKKKKSFGKKKKSSSKGKAKSFSNGKKKSSFGGKPFKKKSKKSGYRQARA
ncbi:MAG: DEAD/DEAH box helicase [Bdellovibrionales bacterium]|nr:DEAD/DEAH box helicase [Bdellovibrionales bacterium]